MLEIKNIIGESILKFTNITIDESLITEFKIVASFDCFNAVLNLRTELSDFDTLNKRLKNLYEFKYREVLFDTIDGQLTIQFFLTDTYHIKIKTLLYNNDSSGKLSFEFTTDQTLLLEFINDLSIVERK